jgi:cyclopropane fatty-acyl-phospholipid synthase-like methyltransferase
MTAAAQLPILPGGGLDWSPTSRDYLQHRPGYPDSFFRLLQQLGLGIAGQDILDLGTGTGALAIPLAQAGAHVVGVDASEGQLAAAREAAARARLTIAFKFARAEATGLPDAAFDAITASMCWGYFETARMVEEVPRLLRQDGVLLIASLIWTRDRSEIARATDAVIQRYNDAFVGNSQQRDDRNAPVPAWSVEHFRLRSYHSYVEPLAFTNASWRGRLRASKWIGAALPSDRVEAFDRELDAILQTYGDAPFTIPHRITLSIFEPRRIRKV